MVYKVVAVAVSGEKLHLFGLVDLEQTNPFDHDPECHTNAQRKQPANRSVKKGNIILNI